MKKIFQVPVGKISAFKKYSILMEGGDMVYLSGNDFSLPALMGSSGVETVRIINCMVGGKLKFSYSVKGKKKAILESVDIVKEIVEERK